MSQQATTRCDELRRPATTATAGQQSWHPHVIPFCRRHVREAKRRHSVHDACANSRLMSNFLRRSLAQRNPTSARKMTCAAAGPRGLRRIASSRRRFAAKFLHIHWCFETAGLPKTQITWSHAPCGVAPGEGRKGILTASDRYASISGSAAYQNPMHGLNEPISRALG